MEILSLNFTILQFCGMWRSSKSSSGWKFIIYHCYTIVMLFSLHAFALSQFINLLISSENVKEFTHGCYMFLAMLAGCVRMANVLMKRQAIIELTNVLRNHLGKPRNEDENKVHIECERNARSNTIWYSALGATSVSLITLRSLIVDIPERNLPFKGWLPFHFDMTQVGYWFAYFHQHIAHATGAAINSSFDTLVSGLMMHTCAQMKFLTYRIEDIPRNVKDNRMFSEDADEYEKNGQSLEFELLTECIRHHVQIFQFADSLNDIFGKVIFLQFALSSLVLCVSVYEISAMDLFSGEFVATIMYLSCMIVQIFLFCFYGGEMTIQSVDICDAAYRMHRSALDIKTKKSLITIMTRSQRAITFDCGSIITVSLDSFNSLIKLSYSVYNVLQTSSG